MRGGTAKGAICRRELVAGGLLLAFTACSDRSLEPADGQDWHSADDARLYLEDGKIWLDLHVESLLPESTRGQEQLLKSGFSAKFVYEILLFARIDEQWQSTLARRYDLTLTWNH